jgi:hypothetical protein
MMLIMIIYHYSVLGVGVLPNGARVSNTNPTTLATSTTDHE